MRSVSARLLILALMANGLFAGCDPSEQGIECLSACDSRECGTTAGGCDCGSCPSSEVCSVAGRCEPEHPGGTDCSDACLGRECGTAAGNCECGTCDDGFDCTNGLCRRDEPDCVEECSGRECGTSISNCDCGTCGQNDSCRNGTCVPGQVCCSSNSECLRFEFCDLETNTSCGECKCPTIYECCSASDCQSGQICEAYNLDADPRPETIGICVANGTVKLGGECRMHASETECIGGLPGRSHLICIEWDETGSTTREPLRSCTTVDCTVDSDCSGIDAVDNNGEGRFCYQSLGRCFMRCREDANCPSSRWKCPLSGDWQYVCVPDEW